ncbi:hypothetical protein GCM10009734_23880 [Nonomuraea bangladeshensis]
MARTGAEPRGRRGAGVSVKKIQEMLNHAQSSTTDIYLTVARRLEEDPSDLVAAAIE